MEDDNPSKSSGVGLLVIGLLLSPFMIMVWNAFFNQSSADGGISDLLSIIFGIVPAIASLTCIMLGLARISSKEPAAAFQRSTGPSELNGPSAAEVAQLKRNLFALKAITGIISIVFGVSLFVVILILLSLNTLNWIFAPIFVPATIITGIMLKRNYRTIKSEQKTILKIGARDNRK